MKLATILLWAVALNAGQHADYGRPPRHDDWRTPPSNTPGSPTPEPATWALIGGGLALLAWKRHGRTK